LKISMPQNPFTVDHILNLQRVTCRVPLHLSPDGRWLTVSVQKQMGVTQVATDDDGFTLDGVPSEALGSRVLVVDTKSGEVVEPFPVSGTSWGGQWSPDGQQLVAYVQHEGFACLGLWHVEQRTVRLLREAEVHPLFGFEVPQWTPDSKGVLVKLRNTEPRPSRHTTKPKAEDPPVIIHSFDPAAAPDAEKNISGEFTTWLGDLSRIDVATNEVQRLGSGWKFGGWRLAPDNSAVAVLRAADINLLGNQSCFDLIVVPFDGSAPRTVASRVPSWWATTFSWSHDSRYLAYTSHAPSHLFVVPADGSQEPRRLSTDAGVRADEYAGPCWSPDSRFIYCPYRGNVWEHSPDGSHSRQITAKIKENAADEVGQSRVFRVLKRPLQATLTLLPDGSLPCLLENSLTKRESLGRIRLSDGETEILTECERIDPDGGFSFDATADGSVCYVVREASNRPPEIWSVPLDERGEPGQSQRLMAFNPALDDVDLCSTRLIDWRDADGEVRQAILALPRDYQEGQRLPMIVCIYGDFIFSDEYLHRFGIDDQPYTNAHWLTSHGYAVLYPDMPMKDSDPYRQIPDLVLPAVNRAIDLGFADPGRLGLTGFSYGGYCVMSVITQTTRFRAAMSDGGAGFNMTSQYGLQPSWCEGQAQARLNGTPWDKREVYIENSPLFYMDRVRTPVLLIAGSDDEANAAQAQEVFNALRRLGQRVELRIYNGEMHRTTGWSESNVRDVCARVLSWFDTHLKAEGASD
jgi:dipeptidyl aminopeptidase/acylaminoacyl peptidase